MIPKYDFRRPAKFFGKKIDIETCIIWSNQIKNLKNYSAQIKLENSLSGTSQISKIKHLFSILQCIKQRRITRFVFRKYGPTL